MSIASAPQKPDGHDRERRRWPAASTDEATKATIEPLCLPALENRTHGGAVQSPKGQSQFCDYLPRHCALMGFPGMRSQAIEAHALGNLGTVSPPQLYGPGTPFLEATPSTRTPSPSSDWTPRSAVPHAFPHLGIPFPLLVDNRQCRSLPQTGAWEQRFYLVFHEGTRSIFSNYRRILGRDVHPRPQRGGPRAAAGSHSLIEMTTRIPQHSTKGIRS